MIFFWGVAEIDADVFGSLEWRHEIEVGYIHFHEECIIGGYDTVGKEFGYKHFCRWCGYFTWIIDAFAAHIELCAVWFCFLGLHTAHKLAIGDVFYAVVWDVISADEPDRVGAFDAPTDSVGQLSKIVCR